MVYYDIIKIIKHMEYKMDNNLSYRERKIEIAKSLIAKGRCHEDILKKKR